ncbi:multidrug resistance protein [Bordetella ansorpii]|uniref:Multidrug resistance protein n=1 Tax=Bordetella ansorpii TaxID=288768 RepID=A0A157SKG1_9BORD|nr:DHA2 family efflux MFS transporter permease subunit [Bordetella ansorpii]SAI70885.1 multidrug resistance protein [Bordetella ansorpii]
MTRAAGAVGGQLGWTPRANPWAVAVIVTLAAFMEVLDTTIVNVALPHIAGTMSASYDESTWALTSYLVANSIVLPISAFLGRLMGRKRYFLLCIVMFTVCSFLCGIATELWQLILFRLLQGFFGGGLQPNQQAILLDYFPPEDRGKAFSVSAVAIIVAPIFGPTLGGWITDTFSWRWVFLINVPVGVVTTLAVMQFLEDPPWEKQAGRGSLRIDYIGIGLIALGLGCLEVTLDRGENLDWLSSDVIRVSAVLTAVGLVGAVYWLLYAKRPVVDLRALKDRNFALACACIFGFATVLYGSAVLIPQLAQQQLGYTAMWAGLVLTPGAAIIIFVIPVISKLMPHVQTRFLVAFGFLLLGLSMVYSHGLAPNIDYRTLATMRATQSLGIGLLFVPVTTLAYITLPQRLNGDGTALFTMFRNIAGSVGIAMSSALLRDRTQVRQAYLSEHLSPYDPSFQETLQRMARSIQDYAHVAGDATQAAAGQMYRTLINQATFQAYQDIFAYCAILAFCFVPLTLLFSNVKSSGGAPGH